MAYPIATAAELKWQVQAEVGDTLRIGNHDLAVDGLFERVPQTLLALFPVKSCVDLLDKLAIVALALRLVKLPESIVASTRPIHHSGEADRLTEPRKEKSASPELTAYEVTPGSATTLAPAPRSRPWLGRKPQSGAKRCLPLIVANEAGWFVVSGHTFEASWNGGPWPGDVAIEHIDGPSALPVSCHFGGGIITWTLPYLFRTSPGTNLLARGPANWPRDGVAYLEGLIETDWLPATFTVSWQITRPHLPIRVEAGEPVAMLVPQPRNYLQRFEPTIRRLQDAPELYHEHARWYASRRLFYRALSLGLPMKATWQGHYLRGVTPSGLIAAEHDRKLGLRSFTREPRRTGGMPGEVRQRARDHSKTSSDA